MARRRTRPGTRRRTRKRNPAPWVIPVAVLGSLAVVGTGIALAVRAMRKREVSDPAFWQSAGRLFPEGIPIS